MTINQRGWPQHSPAKALRDSDFMHSPFRAANIELATTHLEFVGA